MSFDSIVRNIFKEKPCKKCESKDSPKLLCNLVNSAKEPLDARNSFKNNNKKIKFILFLLNTVPFNGQDYEKQKRPGTSDHSSGYKTSSKKGFAQYGGLYATSQIKEFS